MFLGLERLVQKILELKISTGISTLEDGMSLQDLQLCQRNGKGINAKLRHTSNNQTISSRFLTSTTALKINNSQIVLMVIKLMAIQAWLSVPSGVMVYVKSNFLS